MVIRVEEPRSHTRLAVIGVESGLLPQSKIGNRQSIDPGLPPPSLSFSAVPDTILAVIGATDIHGCKFAFKCPKTA